MTNDQEKKAEKFKAAKELSLKYLSYRQRTAWEVRKRLLDRGYDDEIVNLVLDFLKEYKFLDDDSFVQMWIRSRTKEKPSGRRRIYTELVQKGLDRNLIEHYLAEITPQKEEQMAKALVERKCRRGTVSYKRLHTLLIRRGFHPDIVSKVLSRFLK